MEEEIMSFNHNAVVDTQTLLEDFNVDQNEFEELTKLLQKKYAYVYCKLYQR